MFEDETHAMSQVESINVVKMICNGLNQTYQKPGKEDKKINYVALEYAEMGELHDFIAVDTPFSEDIARFYFIQIMNGLKDCHEIGIAHRDLKPSNILIDDQNNLKIADFGIAQALEGRDGKNFLHTICGTPGFKAPEIDSGQPYKGA